jgi:hypothetical protein
MTFRVSNVDSVKAITVIEVVAIRGAGKDSSDPVRAVREYWSLDGELLAERDPLVELKR